MVESLQHIISSDGSTVVYRRFGNGPRLITVLHSLALDGSWYQPLAQALGEQYTLLAPDYRGHGESPRGNSDISLSLVAQDIAAIWDAENIKSSVILGISLGGMVAQALTGTFPGRIDAQILMATSGAFNEQSISATLERAEFAKTPEGISKSADVTMERWFGDRAQDATDPLVKRGRTQFLNFGGNTLAEYFVAMTTVGDFQTETPPPTLVLGGDDDRSTPRPVVEALAASLPDAELHFAKGGHLVAFENPLEVAATVRPFLDGLDSWSN